MQNSMSFIVCAVFFTGGCTTLQNQSRVDPQTIAIMPQVLGEATNCAANMKIPGDTWAGAFHVKCMPLVNGEGTEVNAYTASVANPVMRNRMADALMKKSDDICIVEMGRLTGNEAMVNTIFSTATSALAAIGSVVNGEMAKAIFSAGAGLTNSTRDHFRAEVYRNFVSYQVVKAIRLERTKIAGDIERRYGDKIGDWSAEAMIRRVNQYHHLCSFSVGLSLIDVAVSRSGSTLASRHEALTAAINALAVRINSLNANLADKNFSESAKAELLKQRDALIAKQTELYEQQAKAAVGDESPPAAPKEGPSNGQGDPQ